MKPLRAASACVDFARTNGATGGRVVAGFGPRRRGAKLFVLAMIVAVALPAIAVPPPPDPIESDRGTIVFYPRDRHNGWELLAVTRKRDGRLDVSFDPKRLYQDATTQAAMRDGRELVTRYLEIVVDLPAAATTDRAGFVDVSGIRVCCPVEEFEARAGNQIAEVWSNGSDDFLVVISKVGRAG